MSANLRLVADNPDHAFPWTGDPLEEKFWERVWDHIEPEPDPRGCWNWTGQRGNGYGYASFRRHPYLVHRITYQLLVGPIPEGLTIDHLCRNRACCNPDHLEPVTRGENVLRGEGISAENARKTHCKHGHAFTEENTRITPQGHRECRACRREISRRYYHAKKAAA